MPSLYTMDFTGMVDSMMIYSVGAGSLFAIYWIMLFLVYTILKFTPVHRFAGPLSFFSSVGMMAMGFGLLGFDSMISIGYITGSTVLGGFSTDITTTAETATGGVAEDMADYFLSSFNDAVRSLY